MPKVYFSLHGDNKTSLFFHNIERLFMFILPRM